MGLYSKDVFVQFCRLNFFGTVIVKDIDFKTK